MARLLPQSGSAEVFLGLALLGLICLGPDFGVSQARGQGAGGAAEGMGRGAFGADAGGSGFGAGPSLPGPTLRPPGSGGHAPGGWGPGWGPSVGVGMWLTPGPKNEAERGAETGATIPGGWSANLDQGFPVEVDGLNAMRPGPSQRPDRWPYR